MVKLAFRPLIVIDEAVKPPFGLTLASVIGSGKTTTAVWSFAVSAMATLRLAS